MTLALLILVGCGAEETTTVPVSGTVTVEGKPIDQGAITFCSIDGETPKTGGVIKEGKYTANVEPGDKVVMVLGNEIVGTEQVIEGVPDSGTRDKLRKVTHANYNAEHLTPLKASITGPTENLDFDLKKTGK